MDWTQIPSLMRNIARPIIFIRRGLPKDMVFDNGTNLVGAEKEQREPRELFEQVDLVEFQPPMGALLWWVHETMIK